MCRVCAVRTHAVFFKNVLSNQTKGRLKVFPNFQTAFYIHISVYFSNRAISSSAKSR